MQQGGQKHSIQIKIERGLQSQNLADVLATITDCASYIREYPFPAFIHNILFKLAQAFQGELFGRKFDQSLNAIRLRIVTAIRECSAISLGVTIPSEDIVRCIMKVSHSNDYKARSMTLLFFASLGRLIFDDKKVHNLVIESLDCADQTELSAAIQAANELAKHSLPFSVLVLCKIAEMFSSNRLSHWVSAELMAVVANLRDLSLTKQCLQLEVSLLGVCDHKMRPVIYDSLTKLASRGEQNIPEQISILLNGLSKAISHNDKPLLRCVLLNLSKLSAFPNLWSSEHILTLRDSYSQIELLQSKAVLCAWLQCLEVLSVSEKHNKILIENHRWISLLDHVNVVLRIHAINLALNLVHRSSTANSLFGSSMFDAIIKTLRELLQSSHSPVASSPPNSMSCQRFFALVAKFARGSSCTVRLAKCLTENLLPSADEQALLSLCSSKFPLELLAVICDKYWAECRTFVLSPLVNCVLFAPSSAFVRFPPTFFALLLSVVPSSSFDGPNSSLSSLIDRIDESFPQMDHWTVYLMARSALRYGHWRHFALPLLQRVRTKTQTPGNPRKPCNNSEAHSANELFMMTVAYNQRFSWKKLMNRMLPRLIADSVKARTKTKDEWLCSREERQLETD